MLHSIAEQYPHIAKLSSIGTSVSGRELWVMEISDNVGQNEPGEPDFKVLHTHQDEGGLRHLSLIQYVGNMHGDETVGREVLISFIQYLTSEYATNARYGITYIIITCRLANLSLIRVKELVDSVRIFVLPSMNPDGFELGVRGNARGIDLNRYAPLILLLMMKTMMLLLLLQA